MLKKWEDLPVDMQTEAVKLYYDIVAKKRLFLYFRRAFDIVVSFIMLLVLLPVFALLAIVVKLDSPGPVFYKQRRVTQYGRVFEIMKFRSMVDNADAMGTHVTVSNDDRVTRVGRIIRRCRLDELPQLLNILDGTMTFVGTRPEAEKYVAAYTEEMKATLLLPAGVTSEASIYYKDESDLLEASKDADELYVEEVLPGKMFYNLKSLESLGFFHDIKTMFMTVMVVLGKDYDPIEQPPKRKAEERDVQNV